MTQNPHPISCAHENIYVRAKYDYTSDEESPTILNLRKGEPIRVLSKLESGWWDGLNTQGKRAWFPSNYCEPCETPRELEGAILAKL
jgi:son of sevenless-like protein